MQLEIITPESNIFAGEAQAVQLPGLDGLFQVLNNHAPIISALQQGTVKVELVKPFERTERTSEAIREDKSNKNTILIDVKGGTVEMLNNKMIVLAE
ncbi:MAG: F0F1 ATP synthase subunit epsilon [Crocinitomicaceae bacterium]|jgi:F-type H+-transporting ATPase subunit epsilon|nr:F0F1 ATP synthase subunit epsilon [Crocinitomicaceae bacterium]